MGQFSQSMRALAVKLLTEFGNTATLEKRVKGAYDPVTGETAEVVTTYNTFSGPPNLMTEVFGNDGRGTNLDAFDSNFVIVPWIGEEIDISWTLNGQNIVTVSPIITQDEIVIYNISVGQK